MLRPALQTRQNKPEKNSALKREKRFSCLKNDHVLTCLNLHKSKISHCAAVPLFHCALETFQHFIRKPPKDELLVLDVPRCCCCCSQPASATGITMIHPQSILHQKCTESNFRIDVSPKLDSKPAILHACKEL